MVLVSFYCECFDFLEILFYIVHSLFCWRLDEIEHDLLPYYLLVCEIIKMFNSCGCYTHMPHVWVIHILHTHNSHSYIHQSNI